MKRFVLILAFVCFLAGCDVGDNCPAEKPPVVRKECCPNGQCPYQGREVVFPVVVVPEPHPQPQPQPHGPGPHPQPQPQPHGPGPHPQPQPHGQGPHPQPQPQPHGQGPHGCPVKPVSYADLPVEIRQRNWIANGTGSCNHAAFIVVLRWFGHYELAAKWRETYGGLASAEQIGEICEREGVQFALCTNGDADFLDWCHETRRPAAIHYFPGHAVTFEGYRDGNAILVDNNRPGFDIPIPKPQFVRDWKAFGGRAITLVESPPVPRPW